MAPACLTAAAYSSRSDTVAVCAGVTVKDSSSGAMMTWASFISEVRVEFTVAVSFLMESSLTVVTGSQGAAGEEGTDEGR